MKGLGESNINVWFPIYVFPEMKLRSLIISKKQNYNFCLPDSTNMYLRAIHIFPESVCLFCCSQIGRHILGIYKSLAETL
jgi:hypothetical protein